VGHGEAKSDCGEWLAWACNEVDRHPNGCRVVELGRRSCGRLECPICFSRVAGRIARRAEYRLRQFKHQRFKKIIHVVVSVSKKDYELSYKESYKKAIKITRFCGIIGGAKVFHPWRQKCAVCGHYPIVDTDNPCPECGSKFFNWYFSPHFHIVGFGWVRNVKEVFEETGWVIRNEGVRKTLFGTLSYLLTHCGIRKGRHSLTWFGCCSYAKLRILPMPKEGHFCILCGLEMQRVNYEGIFDGLDPPDQPNEEGFYFVWHSLSESYVYQFLDV